MMQININKATIFAIGVFILAASIGCKRRNEAKERIQAEREKWEASLPDSLKAVERQTDSIKNELQALNNCFDAMVHTFDYVDNPREVEGYYIAGGWKMNYPLKSTGLVARITKSEKLELIAALAGNAHFNRIRVATNDQTAETSTVVHDQALNYRMDGLNTVCFSDSAATSCAKLIAENNGSDITIIYLEDNKQTGTLSYSKQAQSLMMSTWNLYEVLSRIARDERMIPMLAKKGAIINQKIQQIDSQKQ
ncbi:MAG: hypothetical protein K2K32_05915 [Muribaculaceae bacterium]|nr:hypothetical protein [Muribaculaceae bacterium]